MREELSRVSEIEEIDFDGDSALIVLSTDYLFVPQNLQLANQIYHIQIGLICQYDKSYQ